MQGLHSASEGAMYADKNIFQMAIFEFIKRRRENRGRQSVVSHAQMVQLR